MLRTHLGSYDSHVLLYSTTNVFKRYTFFLRFCRAKFRYVYDRHFDIIHSAKLNNIKSEWPLINMMAVALILQCRNYEKQVNDFFLRMNLEKNNNSEIF